MNGWSCGCGGVGGEVARLDEYRYDTAWCVEDDMVTNHGLSVEPRALATLKVINTGTEFYRIPTLVAASCILVSV